MKYELTPLPFAQTALEPWIDATTVSIHHDKHQATYVNNLNAALAKFPDLAGRVKIVGKSALPLSAKGVMMSSGTMSLSCCLAGIPGAIVYKANPLTYICGRMVVNIEYLGIANILLDKPAWREFIQFDASAEKIAAYMKAAISRREEYADYARELYSLLRAEAEHDAADWLLRNV